MNDTVLTVIAVVLTAVLIFIYPVMTMAERIDTVSRTDVESLTSEFVSEIKTTGKITKEKYSRFLEELSSIGNTYDVEMEVRVMDENPGKKSLQGATDKIGENTYYSIYTTQILDTIDTKGVLNLKEGDMVYVTIRNTNLTLSQNMKKMFYGSSTDQIYTIKASQAGMVTTNGNAK